MQPEENRQVTEERDVQSADGTAMRHETVSRDESKTSTAVVAQRVIWYIAGVIIALLLIRIALYLFGASTASSFVQFIYNVTWVFAAPFYGIFPQPEYGRFALDTASIVAVIVYALVAWGLAKLFTLNRTAR